MLMVTAKKRRMISALVSRCCVTALVRSKELLPASASGNSS